jgi:hypothetical protein
MSEQLTSGEYFAQENAATIDDIPPAHFPETLALVKSRLARSALAWVHTGLTPSCNHSCSHGH